MVNFQDVPIGFENDSQEEMDIVEEEGIGVS